MATNLDGIHRAISWHRDRHRATTTAATLALTGFPRSARAASAVLGDDVDGSRWLQPVPADACAMISLEGAFHA